MAHEIEVVLSVEEAEMFEEIKAKSCTSDFEALIYLFNFFQGKEGETHDGNRR